MFDGRRPVAVSSFGIAETGQQTRTDQVVAITGELDPPSAQFESGIFLLITSQKSDGLFESFQPESMLAPMKDVWPAEQRFL